MSIHQPAKVAFGPGSRAGIATVAVLLLVPAIAALFTDHEARSNWEKRPLTSWHSVVTAGGMKSRFARLEDYINDHIGFALTLNRFYRQTQFYLFGDSPVANVNVGKDGFLFVNSHSPDKPYIAIERLCEPNKVRTDRVRADMTAVAKFAAERNISTTLAVIPSKLLLYSDRLPATVPRELRKACRDLNPWNTVAGVLASEPASGPYKVYYPFDKMVTMRDREAFYPPGNFHANSMINHEFSRGLLSQLGIDLGDNYPSRPRLGQINSDLTMLGFGRRISAWKYGYKKNRLKWRRQQPEWIRDYYTNARDFKRYTAENPLSPRRALVLSNSFGAYIVGHLAPGFSELYHININHLKAGEANLFLTTVLDRVRPNDLLYIVHDAGLPSTPFTELAKSLKKVP